MFKKKKQSIISLLRKKMKFQEAVRKLNGHTQLADCFSTARREYVQAFIWYLHICFYLMVTTTKQFL